MFELPTICKLILKQKTCHGWQLLRPVVADLKHELNSDANDNAEVTEESRRRKHTFLKNVLFVLMYRVRSSYSLFVRDLQCQCRILG